MIFLLIYKIFNIMVIYLILYWNDDLDNYPDDDLDDDLDN